MIVYKTMIDILIKITPFVVTGFLLGIRHAFEADHVATISSLTLKTKNRAQALFLGAWWGLGHTITLLLIGILILIFKINMPINISNIFEIIVAIILGILGLETVYKTISNNRIHTHEDNAGSHFHLFEYEHSHRHKSFVIGMLHGLAGSSALIFVALGGINTTEGILLILMFGLGSILGMSLISFTISIPFSLAYNAPTIEYYLKLITGALSILIAIAMLY